MTCGEKRERIDRNYIENWKNNSPCRTRARTHTLQIAISTLLTSAFPCFQVQDLCAMCWVDFGVRAGYGVQSNMLKMWFCIAIFCIFSPPLSLTHDHIFLVCHFSVVAKSNQNFFIYRLAGAKSTSWNSFPIHIYIYIFCIYISWARKLLE